MELTALYNFRSLFFTKYRIWKEKGSYEVVNLLCEYHSFSPFLYLKQTLELNETREQMMIHLNLTVSRLCTWMREKWQKVDYYERQIYFCAYFAKIVSSTEKRSWRQFHIKSKEVQRFRSLRRNSLTLASLFFFVYEIIWRVRTWMVCLGQTANFGFAPHTRFLSYIFSIIALCDCNQKPKSIYISLF